MIRYFDTGYNGVTDSLGRWLDAMVIDGIRSFRGQFGFFDSAALHPYLPVLRGMVDAGGALRLVIGANTGHPPTTDDLAAMLPLLGPADRTSLTIVGLSGALFHPKTIHLVRADGRQFGVVSSANFTRKGLGHSVEAGLTLESAPGTDVVVRQIAEAIDRWATVADPGVYQVRTTEDIERLRGLGLVVTPAARRAIRRRQQTAATTTGRGTRPVGWRPTAAPAELPETEGEEVDEAVEPEAAPAPEIPALTRLWQSKPLTRRDLTIPTARGTNQTGSVNLDKGLLPQEVDHRHYFRDEVFRDLRWERRSATVDEAFARFELVIDGVSLGAFDLPIRHTTSTDSAAYRQRNAMTRLSWGPMREHVAGQELIDRTLSLYRHNDDPTQFVLRIEA